MGKISTFVAFSAFSRSIKLIYGGKQFIIGSSIRIGSRTGEFGLAKFGQKRLNVRIIRIISLGVSINGPIRV